VTKVAVAIVGGGGGGGFGSIGGGGGGGEVMVNTALTVTPGTATTVGIGNGGNGGWNLTQSAWTGGYRGTSSQFGSVYAGGGFGGLGDTNVSSSPASTYGGSGGGGNMRNNAVITGVRQSIAGWTSYAGDGGNGGSVGGAGGGGAGGSGASNSAGTGGAGLTLPTLFGSSVIVAGGGGGWTSGSGGTGGGGKAIGSGYSSGTDGGTAGTANTGGGGGAGMAGGTGTVYLQYATPVTFSANGGTGSMSPAQIAAGSAIPANTFVRTGYTFKGWATASTGQVTYSDQSTSAVTAGSTLYAVWSGNTDYAASLNASGTSDYFSASGAQVIPPTGAFTAEAWINPSSSNTNAQIMSQGTGSNRFYLKLNSSNNLIALRDNGTPAEVATTYPLPNNSWSHVAVVFDGTNAIFFVNGQQIQSSSYSLGSVSTGTGFYVGEYAPVPTDAGNAFKGQIDQVKVWGSALTQAQIARSMNTFGDTDSTGQIATSLRDAFGFNENSGTVNDFKNLVTLSASGSPNFASVATVDSVKNIYKFPRSYLTNLGGWVAPSTATYDYLAVAGGGSGGDRAGGGGGAGGMKTSIGTPANRLSISANTVVPITVGAGGIAFYGMGHGYNGTNSVIGTATPITVTGGGGGGDGSGASSGSGATGSDGCKYYSGNSGGSGGGSDSTNPGCGATVTAGSGTGQQGNSGALGSGSTGSANTWTGGGGGGAGSAGSAGNTSGVAGNGGSGLANGITGASICYAGGGGGGAYTGYTAGSGGTCSGLTSSGGAGSAGDTAATNAVPNTGGGGGGSGFTSYNGTPGTGGSGIVVLRASVSSVPTPTFDTPVITGSGTGFTVNITNFDPYFTYTPSITSGSATVSTSGVVTVTGLTAGASFTLTLTDTDGANSAGATLTPPSAPTAVAAKLGDGKVSLTFTQSSSSTSPVSGFQYSTNAGTSWTTASQTSSPITITGLTNGTTYNFLVRAAGAGYGASSTSVSAVPGLVWDVYASNYNASTGVWVDSSANGNNVTATGTVPAKGSYPDSVGFNDSTMFVHPTTTYNGSTDAGIYTIGAWFKTTGSGKIIGFGEANGYDHHMYVGSTGYLYSGLCASGCNTIASNTAVNDGVWRYAVSTFDGTTLKLYINGVLQSSTFTKSGSLANYTGGWRIGGYQLSGWPNIASLYFTGSIGHAFVYHRALAASEISTMYSNEQAPYTPLTISFANGGGTGTLPANSSALPQNNYTLPANTLSKAGYYFSGWNDGTSTYAAGASYTMPASGTVTFTAQWSSVSATVTYNDSIGGTTTATFAPYGSLTLPSPTRTGYVLKGWSTDSGGSNMVGAGGATYYPTQNANQQLNYNFADSASYPGSGTAVTDVSPNTGGVNASITGTTSFTAGTVSTPSYLNISGGAYVQTGQLYSRVGEGSVSAFGWIYANGDGVVLDELGNSDFSWHDSQIEVYNGKLAMRMYSGAAITSTATVTNGWHYVGFTFGGGTLTGYLDGAAFATSTSYTRSSNPNNSIFYALGKSDTTDLYTSATGNFRLGAFQVWNSGLTSTAVANNFKASCGIYSVAGCTGPTLYAQWLPVAATPTVSNPSAASKTVGQGVTFSTTASTTDGGTLSYQWKKGGVAISGATNSSYTISSVASGDAADYTVTVTNTLYSGQAYQSTASTTSAAATLTVGSAPTITTPTTGLSATYNSAYSLTVSGTTSTAGKTFSVTGTLPPGLTLNTTTGVISGTPTTAGNYPITVTLTDGNTVAVSTSQFTIAVAKVNQTITFGALANKTMGTGTVSLSASASSGNAVTFTSADTSKCTVSGSIVSLVAAGTCTINANQAGDTNYNAATQVSQAFTIAAALSLTTPTGAGLSATVGTAYSLAVTNSGGAGSNAWVLATGTLPAGLTLNSSTGVISGTPTAAGSQTVSVKVTDANGANLTTSNFTIAVAAGNQTITFPAISARNVNSGNFTVAPTTSATGLTVTLNSTSQTVCTVSGFNVTVLTSGNCTLVASQAGTADWNVATNITQIAVINPTVVTFNSNFGTPTTTTQSLTAAGNVALTSNGFTRPGYSFAGWNTVALGGGTAYTDGQSVNFSAATTLYAQWAVTSQSVTYSLNGATTGTLPTQANVATGSSFTTAASTGITKTGYTFGGWTDGSATTPASTSYLMGANSVTLTAVWTPTSQTVTYLLNGGSGTAPTQANVLTAGTFTVASTTSTKAGYSFGGWTDGTNNYLANSTYTMGATNVTLTAIWNATSQSISYNAGSGTGTIAATTGNTGASVTLADGTGMSRLGYTLASWNTNSAGTGTSYTAGSALNMPAGGLTLYAIWSANTHTVAYSLNGGSGTVPTQTDVATAATFTTAASTGINKAGYTFGGWSDGSTTTPASTSYLMGTANVTLTAVWAANTNTVTYDSQLGSAVSAGSFTTGGSLTLPATNPVRAGYSFAGWFTAATGGTALQSPYSPSATAGITLYAQWTANSNTVTYSTQGGSTVAAGSFNTDSSFTLAAAPNRTGYTFAGWFTAASGGTALQSPYSPSATAGITLYAQWTANTYNVTYDSQLGSAVAAGTFTTAGTVSLPSSNPNRTGYIFAGWFPAASGGTALTSPYTPGITNDITLYAHWTAIGYSVTYNASTATGGSVPTDSTTYNIGNTITVLGNTGTLARTGYTFAGWTSASDGSGTVYSAGNTIAVGSASVNLYAKWAAVNYTVTYSSTGTDGGTAPVDSANYNITQSVVIRGNTGSLIRSGYTFAGWTDNSAGTGTVYVSGNTYTVGSANLTFYPKWTAVNYTVTYQASTADSGTVPTDSANYNIGGSVTVLGNTGTLVRAGYTFGGWTTAADGSGTVYQAAGSVSVGAGNINLYAKWTPINYTVTYQPNSATEGAAPTDATNYNIGQSITVRGNTGTLVRTGYSFAGWNTAADGTGTTYQSGNQILVGSASVTLYAKWTANTYTVTYNANGASGTLDRASDSYTTASNAVTLPGQGTLAKTGYNFGGWSATPSGSAISGTYTTAANVTLYAVWNIKSISVTYLPGIAAGASFAQFPTNTSANYATSISVGSNIDGRATVNNTSYDFLGWSDGSSIYQSGSPYTLSDTNVVFTAQWVPVYAVRYVFNGGTAYSRESSIDLECAGVPDSTCTSGQVITTNHAPTRDGYTFNGWVDQSSTPIAAAALTTISATSYIFYATWTPIDYAVTYAADGGSTAPTQASRRIGQTFTVGNAINKTGYSFAGWNDGSQTYGPGATYVVGTSDVTLTAQWIPDVYNVTYDWNGGHGSTTNDVAYTVGTSAISLPLVTDHVKDGYNFNGWSTSPSGNLLGTTYVPTASTTLYAIWGNGSYTLTMDANGGSVTNTSYSVANGSAQALPTPTRSHFHFDGWFDAASNGTLLGLAGANFTPSASKTLYAHWTQDSLYGMGASTKIGSLTLSNVVVPQFSASSASSSVSVSVPLNTLPTNTTVDVYLLTDTSRAASLISGTNNFIVNLVVSWLAPDGTVPTASGAPVSVTINNASIKAGAAVYTLIGNTATYVGTATQDGQVTVTITDDPELVVAAVVPGAPLAASAVAGNGDAVVSWNAPASNGGSPVSSYLVTSSGGQTCTATSSLSCTVSGLTNGTAYTFTVQAINSVGASVASASTAAVTPLGPQTITFGALSNRTMGTGTVTVSATASSGLTVTFTTGNSAICTVSGSVVTLVSPGSCVILANQAGGSGYSAANQVSQSFTVSPALTLATPSAGSLNATYGSAYSLNLISTGGAGSNTFAISSGTLPAGLSIDAGTGVISGTPSAATTAPISVTVTDANGATKTVSFNITVAAAGQSSLVLTTTSGTFGAALSLAASGGSSTGSVSFTVVDGTTACTLNGASLSAAGAGTCTVTATRAADSNYSAISSAPTTVTFDKAQQAAVTLTSTSGTYLTPLNLQTSGGSGGGSVTYAVAAGSTTCTLSAGVLTAAHAGTCLVIATKAGGNDYLDENSAQTVVTFAAANQASLSVSSLSGTYGVTLNLATTGGSGLGDVSYAVTAGSTTCSLNGSTLTANGAGTCSVTATKAATTDFNAISSSAATITFAAGTQAAVNVTSTSGTYLTPLTLTANGGSSTATGYTFTVANGSTTCSFDGTSITTTGAGTCLVTATKAGDANYNAQSSAATTVTFARAAQTVTFTAPANRTLGMAAFSISASSSSGNAVSFSTATPAVCTVSGSTVTLVAAGACTLSADQAGDANYLSANRVQRTFTVSGALVVNVTNPGQAAFVNTAYSLTMTSSGGAGSNQFAIITGSLPAGLTIDATTGTISGIPTTAGTSALVVSVTDANGATASTASFNIVVATLNQSTLTLVTLSGTYGTPLSLSAVGGSGNGAVTYSVAAGSTTCTLSGTTLTANGAGTCLVTASKAADGTYNAVSTSPTAVTFGQAAQSSLTMVGGTGTALTPVTLAYAGGSGTGAVTYAVTNGTATCTISGSILTPTTAGTCTVTATKAADANYSQATSNTVTYTFALATQAALSVTSVSGTATTPLALTVGGGSGTGAVTYVVTDGTTTCTLANGSVIASAAGTCFVTATKAADAAYSQAVSPQATLAFAAAPVVAPIGGGGASPAPVAPPVASAPAPEAWATPVATVEAKAGQNVLVVGDKVISASTEVTADKQGLKVVTPDWQFTLKVQASAGAAANQEATSGTQLVVTTGQTVAVAGDKFQAGSTVKVWIFSDPILLGTVKVNPDGTFASTLSVPTGLELGNHTLVLQGVNSKNEVQNAQAPLLLKANSPASKPVTLNAVVRFAIGSAHVSTVTHRMLAQLMHQLAGLKQITISAVTYYRHPASAPRAAKLGAQRAAVLRKALKRASIQATVIASTAATSVAANIGQPLVLTIQGVR
jgi:uncharacterized repeat protein (TIGR02543 family)